MMALTRTRTWTGREGEAKAKDEGLYGVRDAQDAIGFFSYEWLWYRVSTATCCWSATEQVRRKDPVPAASKACCLGLA